MARVRNMQGVSAHLEYLKTGESRKRHPAHCVYAVGNGKNRICDCPENPKWRQHCGSSSRCENYIDKNEIEN